MRIFAGLVLGLGVLACASRTTALRPPLVSSFTCSVDSVNADGMVRTLHITHDATQPIEIAIAIAPTPDTATAWSFVLEGSGSVGGSTIGSRAQCDLRGTGLGRALSLHGSSSQPIMVSLVTLDATVRSSATVNPGASGSLTFGH